jgi:CsoR family transcriptional regulator, copper-sensing transcriptional repressor
VSEIQGEIVGNRIQLRRDAEAKRPLVQRLNRIEGQIRGLRGMIEEDRYCLDEIQQITALTAALREVAVMIIGEHVTAGMRIAAEPGADRETALADMIRVLRVGMQYKG